MGFYDNRIKRLMRKSPRLVVLAINSIFDKNYDENTEVRFLDKELPNEETDDSTYMDMLLGLLDDEFHWEFQLAEGHMSVVVGGTHQVGGYDLLAAREHSEH